MELMLVTQPSLLSEPKRLQVRETIMTSEEVEAVQHLHDEFSELNITLVSKPEQAGQEVLSALSGISPQENLLRKLALELGQEVMKHPDARGGGMFTLHLRSMDAETEAVLPTVGNSITRLVALPVGSTNSTRGNLMPHDITALCDDWTAAANQDLFMFTAYPSFIDESELIDREQERQTLNERQVIRLRGIQGKILAEVAAASMQDLTAQIGLISTLGNLHRMGAQLGAYQQATANSKVDVTEPKAALLQASRSIRNENRALVDSLKKDAMNGLLSPQLRETLRAGLKELRATGVLAEKHAPKIIIVPRLKMAATTGFAKSLPTAKVIPLGKTAEPSARLAPAKASPLSGQGAAGRSTLFAFAKIDPKTKVDLKNGASPAKEVAAVANHGSAQAAAKISPATPSSPQKADAKRPVADKAASTAVQPGQKRSVSSSGANLIQPHTTAAQDALPKAKASQFTQNNPGQMSVSQALSTGATVSQNTGTVWSPPSAIAPDALADRTISATVIAENGSPDNRGQQTFSYAFQPGLERSVSSSGANLIQLHTTAAQAVLPTAQRSQNTGRVWSPPLSAVAPDALADTTISATVIGKSGSTENRGQQTSSYNVDSPQTTRSIGAVRGAVGESGKAVESKTVKEIVQKFEAAAKGACAGCGGGNCAACTRGQISMAKADAIKTALKAKFG